MSEVKEKVDRLEEAMMRLVYIQQKTEMEIQSLKQEMKEFKDEMKDFKDEMKEFKNEMKEFKDEMKKEVKRINKQWGELSNKLGTIVEDIVLPATRPIIKKYFKCDPDTLMANVEKKLNGKN